MSTHVFGPNPGVLVRPATGQQNQWWRRVWVWFMQAPAEGTRRVRARRFYPNQRNAVVERSTLAREMYRL